MSLKCEKMKMTTQNSKFTYFSYFFLFSYFFILFSKNAFFTKISKKSENDGNK